MRAQRARAARALTTGDGPPPPAFRQDAGLTMTGTEIVDAAGDHRPAARAGRSSPSPRPRSTGSRGSRPRRSPTRTGTKSARALLRLVEHPSGSSTRCSSPSRSCRPARPSSPRSSPTELFGAQGRRHRLRPQRRRLLRARRGDAEDVGGAVRRAGRAGHGAPDRLAGVVPAAAPHQPGADRADQRAPARQGPQGGAVRQRAGAARHRRGGRRRRGDRARGARADREHHRVRRHRRPRGDGAAAGHGHRRPTTPRSPQALDLAIAHGVQPAAGRRATTATTSSASPTPRT